MSDPRWRDARPSRSYGGEPGGRTPRREPRGSDPRRAGDGPGRGDDGATRRRPASAQADPTQPVAPPRADARATEARAVEARAVEARAVEGPAAARNGTSRRAANGTGRGAGPRARRRGAGRGAALRAGGADGRLSRIWQGSLSGGLGVSVIAGSAVIGAVATIVIRSEPGSVLGLSVLAGTVAAALTVQPRTGRLIFPVPALSYLLAALAAGVVYDRSTNKTELAVGAAQWIANGFFVMVLATLLAIALTTVRWVMWRRDQRGPVVPPEYGGWNEPRPPGPPPRTQPGQQRPPAAPGWDQRPGPRTGSGPYNFSSGA
jgi:hypothetical protein